MPRDGIVFPYVYTECGMNPLIFVPPFGGTMDIWRQQRIYFDGLDYRVILYDQRGHGRNQGTASDGKRGEYSIDLFAHDLEAVMDHCKIGRATIVGASLGGMVALQYAAMHPDRVNSLVLVGSYAGPLLKQGKQHVAENRRMRNSFLKDHRRLRTEGIAALKKEKIASYFGKSYEELSADEQRACDFYFRGVAEMSPKEYTAIDLAILYKPDQMENLKTLGEGFKIGRMFNRIHFITGERDFFREAQTEMQAAAPGSKIITIPDAGHLCWLNQPQIFNESLEQCFRDEASAWMDL